MYIECIVKITGITALQQSKEYASTEPKQKSETHDAYEKRCWHLRAHTTAEGKIYHPGAAFKQSIVKAAQYLGTQIQGQGKKTYTQKFQSGLTVVDNLDTGVNIEKAEQRAVFASSTGKTGQGGRVWKYFPTLPVWDGKLTFHIYDPIITKEVFTEHLDAAGKFIGIGTWRPANGGEYGRFTAKILSWKEIG